MFDMHINELFLISSEIIKTYSCEAKVKIDGLGVADVQDTVGLWRETSDYSTAGFFQVLRQQLHGLVGQNVAVSFVVLA
jgi:hypothetical protein